MIGQTIFKNTLRPDWDKKITHKQLLPVSDILSLLHLIAYISIA